tara:strand:+ start:148 stop:864 length:717 start_codon:yes stop_codon:yes gene_type:complete
MAAQGKAQAGRARFASQHAAPVPTFDGTGCVACGATTCRRWFFDRMSCTLPGIVDALEAGEALPTRRWFCTGKAQTSACRTAMKKVPAKDLTEWDGSELPSERTLRFDGEAFIGPFVAGTSSGLTVGRRGAAGDWSSWIPPIQWPLSDSDGAVTGRVIDDDKHAAMLEEAVREVHDAYLVNVLLLHADMQVCAHRHGPFCVLPCDERTPSACVRCERDRWRPRRSSACSRRLTTALTL